MRTDLTYLGTFFWHSVFPLIWTRQALWAFYGAPQTHSSDFWALTQCVPWPWTRRQERGLEMFQVAPVDVDFFVGAFDVDVKCKKLMNILGKCVGEGFLSNMYICI